MCEMKGEQNDMLQSEEFKYNFKVNLLLLDFRTCCHVISFKSIQIGCLLGTTNQQIDHTIQDNSSMIVFWEIIAKYQKYLMPTCLLFIWSVE